MNIDRGQVSYNIKSRHRLGDYQCDGTDASQYVPVSGGMPGSLPGGSGAGSSVVQVADGTPIIPDNAAMTVPSIVQRPVPGESLGEQFNCWIDDHPFLAVAALAGLFFVFRKGGRR